MPPDPPRMLIPAAHTSAFYLAPHFAKMLRAPWFHHLIGCYHPKELKIELRQQTKLREKQCAYFHDSCSRRHFDSPETLRAQFHFSPG